MEAKLIKKVEIFDYLRDEKEVYALQVDDDSLYNLKFESAWFIYSLMRKDTVIYLSVVDDEH